MKQPVFISVVIPTYKRTKLLQRCLEALQQQNITTGFEVIVVTDGIDEETSVMMQTFSSRDNRFMCMRTTTKAGPAAARNAGWKSASGILIAFTDDDTIPDAGWLQSFYQSYTNEKEIAYTGKIKVPVSFPPTDYEKNTAGLEKAAFVTANCCCTKKALEKTGGFDERFTMAWREDSDLQFQLMLHQIPIVHLPQALVIHPVRKAEWGISLKEQKKGMFNALLYKKYPQLYRKKIQPSPLWNYYTIVLSSFIFIISLLLQITSLMYISIIIWMMLNSAFIYQRLKKTSKKTEHIAEMICTSVCIPYISIYWQLYGSWRFRVFFL